MQLRLRSIFHAWLTGLHWKRDTRMPQIQSPATTNNVMCMIIRKVLSWIKRRYDDMIAIFVQPIEQAYNTWQIRRYCRRSIRCRSYGTPGIRTRMQLLTCSKIVSRGRSHTWVPRPEKVAVLCVNMVYPRESRCDVPAMLVDARANVNTAAKTIKTVDHMSTCVQPSSHTLTVIEKDSS
jgi:hypothetical protein